MRKALTNIILCTGIILIVISLVIAGSSYIRRNSLIKDMPQTVEQLRSLMPEVHGGFVDDRFDTSMSTVVIDNTDYVGVVEVPQYKTICPVSFHWNNENIKNQPCRYSGSIYSSDFIMGGTDYQLGFAKLINVGDEIRFTDMSGAMFNYTVYSIAVEKDFSPDLIISENSDFILFIKDTRSGEYTIIYCQL